MGIKYSGAEWLEHALKVKPSEFGVKVADLLGDWAAGIYHIETSKLAKAEWTSDHYIEVVYYGDLSTYDNENLTRLVILCHERCIRLGIAGRAKNYVMLSFSPRQREGRYWERHQSIDDAVAATRAHYGVTTP
jgi:hypothetical protein